MRAKLANLSNCAVPFFMPRRRQLALVHYTLPAELGCSAIISVKISLAFFVFLVKIPETVD